MTGLYLPVTLFLAISRTSYSTCIHTAVGSTDTDATTVSALQQSLDTTTDPYLDLHSSSGAVAAARSLQADDDEPAFGLTIQLITDDGFEPDIIEPESDGAGVSPFVIGLLILSLLFLGGACFRCRRQAYAAIATRKEERKPYDMEEATVDSLNEYSSYEMNGRNNAAPQNHHYHDTPDENKTVMID
jgi:hypothetical protein